MDYVMLAGMIPGGPELIIILIVILLLFGSTRLPQLARGMGKSISEFKKGVSEGGEKDDERELAEKRREQLVEADRERLREDELAAADKLPVNKSR
ncbi:MAG: sec-independent protein translocase protein TatA [Acidobacteriota bacterium]|nr:sec-independent protein translocase protein TatA [Acidobacteriota bacterium]